MTGRSLQVQLDVRRALRRRPLAGRLMALAVVAPAVALGVSALPAASAAVATPAGRAAPAVLAAPAAVPGPPSGWSTVFSDDFNGAAGSGIDSQWMYDTGPGSNFGTGEIETMTNSTSNVHLDGNGNLDLTALGSGSSWTSGRVQTTTANVGAPAGGELEVTASIQQPAGGLGYWPAFWMLGPGQWPENGEIDIMEDVNSLSELSGTIHCGTDPGGPCNETNGIGSGLTSCAGCQGGFHTYTMILNRTNTSNESITFYLDGNQYFSVSESQVGTSTWQAAFDHNLSILLDLAMGGGFPNGVCGCTTPTSSTSSGGTMNVAYVAAYTTTGGGAGGGGGGGRRESDRADHRPWRAVRRRPRRESRRLHSSPGLYLQRHQRSAVDRRGGRQHVAGARQVPGYQLGRHRRRNDGGPVHLQWHGGAGLHPAIRRRALQPAIWKVPRRHQLLNHTRHAATDLGLYRQHQPELAPALA